MSSVIDIDHFDQMVSSGSLRLLHRGRSSRLYIDGEDAQAPLVYKEFLPRDSFDRLKRIFAGSRAKRSIRANSKLANCGFLVLEPVSIFESPSILAAPRSVLVTKFEAGKLSLRDRLPEIYSAKERRRLMLELAKDVAKMHQLGVAHDDMNIGNILLVDSDQGYQFIWCDIERIRCSFYHGFRLSSRQVLKNLRQLGKIDAGITNKEKLFFLSKYLKQRRIKKNTKRVLLSRLVALSNR